MQIILFLIRTVRTDTHVVEDTGRKGSRKANSRERFQMPFQNFTVSLISGFSGKP